MQKIPITVITGFLGAGKTTLLKHLLSQDHGRQLAIIVNEFGEIGIDQQLVIGVEEEILEMNNGCLCCNVRSDLVRTLLDLIPQKHRFDGIVIETTGLANPAPIIHTVASHPMLNFSYEMDAVVTLVDAKHLGLSLHQDAEAMEQIAYADLILMNKVDLCEEQVLEKLVEEISHINNQAPVLFTEYARVDFSQVFNRHAYDLSRQQAIREEGEKHSHHHQHALAVQSISFSFEGSLSAEGFQAWMEALNRHPRMQLYRYKGIINLEGDDDRIVFQGVHQLFESDSDRPWRSDEVRLNQFVFIGKNLDEELIRYAMQHAQVGFDPEEALFRIPPTRIR
jgi:G3E family GTPase